MTWDTFARWADQVSLLQLVLATAAVLTIITLIVKAWPWVRKAVALVDALGDLPAFMRRTDARIKDIHHEVHYNNGSSVKDAVERVETGVASVHQKFDEHLVDAAKRDRAIAEQLARIKKLEDTQPHPGSGVPKRRKDH